jgi:hypothetical protein
MANNPNLADGKTDNAPPQSRIITPYYKQIDQDSLEFDSVFESGNLALAIKVSNLEYNCLL